MATKKKKDDQQTQPEPAGGDVLQKAAKVVGGVLGTIAATTGLDHAEEPPQKRAKRPKAGKLAKKDKKRLPRRQKKQAKKAQQGHSAG